MENPVKKFAQSSIKSSRIPEFDIVRVLAMFWVVTYHFGMEYRDSVSGAPLLNFFCVTPNFDFGNVSVTMFLVLSGALLYRKYKDCNIGNLGHFYKARARAIYPPFWIMNLYVVLTMVRHLFSDGSPFYAGNPLKLLLTVSGFDGYVQMFGFRNYYFCGEWFVGAILILYLLFPTLAWLYKKCPKFLFAILTTAYFLQFLLPKNLNEIFSILPCTLMLKFALGFLLVEFYSKLQKPFIGGIAFLLFVLLCLVDIPGLLKTDFLGTLAGLLLFVAILGLGGFVRGASQKVVSFLAPISYCVFLIQHIAIVWLQIVFIKIIERLGFALNGLSAFALLVATFILIVAVAWCLKIAADKLTARVWPR